MKNNIWEILGIEPTAVKREIKKAYAAQSKLHHPDEDPEGFAQLNEAYQQALQYADGHAVLNEKIEIPYIEPKQNVLQSIAELPLEEVREMEEVQEVQEVPSLLDKLNEAEARKAAESRENGALYALEQIFEDERSVGKQEIWQNFFLSDKFLDEQDNPQFIKGMIQYLEKLEALPRAFALELVIAYALFTEAACLQFIGYGLFELISPYAEDIWGKEPENPLRFDAKRTLGLIERDANIVRIMAFADYRTLKVLNANGMLNEKEQKAWEKLLYGGLSKSIYEYNRGGKINSETRGQCMLRLYEHWLKTDKVPLCVCAYMYKEYGLKNIDHSSMAALYGGLKKEILKSYPAIEQELFDSKSKKQQDNTWYKELLRIVSDYHSSYYSKRIYDEPEEIKDRIEALFAREEWEEIKDSYELFEKIHREISVRIVIPVSLADKLLKHYRSESGGDYNADELREMREGLVRALHFNRSLHENDYRNVYVYERTSVEDITENNERFWEYFIATGYGCRYRTAMNSYIHEKPFVCEDKQYLPGYMDYHCRISKEWIKLFTDFDDENEEIQNPRSYCFDLPDGRKLRAEFHFHYVEFYLDEKQIIEPVFTFDELMEYAEKLQKTECILILLAVTAIQEDERERAVEEIKKWLSKIAIYPELHEFIAQAIAADNARIIPAENEAKRVQAIVYGEQIRFCFKIEVFMRGIKMYRQTAFGWEPVELLSGEGKEAKGLDLDGKIAFAKEKLRRMHQPKPIKMVSYSLEGLSNVEKVRKIIDAMKEREQYCKRNKRKQAYRPGFPWKPEDVTQSVSDFFEQDGGWLLETFAVLHMGNQHKKCFERIFYAAMNIFGFDLYFHSPDHDNSCKYQRDSLSRKIKEKHLVVGRFGWGDVYELSSSFAPVMLAIGESGTYYAMGLLKMYREKSLPEILANVFDFSEVSQVDIYENRLSVSRFDRKLEYCYTEKDYEEYLDTKTLTLPEMFTKFGI